MRDPGSTRRGRPTRVCRNVDGLRRSMTAEDRRGFGISPWISPQALQFLQMQSRPAGINGRALDTTPMTGGHRVPGWRG